MIDLRRLVATLVLLLLLGGCASPGEGRRAPPLRGEKWLLLEGSDASAVLQGSWGLVVFFRPGIRACEEGIAEWKEVAAAYRAAGLVAVGVTPDGADAAREFIRRHSLPFPVLAGAHRALEDWGLPELWLNRAYLVGPEGILVAENDLAATRRILAKYLGRR